MPARGFLPRGLSDAYPRSAPHRQVTGRHLITLNDFPDVPAPATERDVRPCLDLHWTVIGPSLDLHWTFIGPSLDLHYLHYLHYLACGWSGRPEEDVRGEKRRSFSRRARVRLLELSSTRRASRNARAMRYKGA